MYDIISVFQCYTISVDVYFPFHCTLWMACFTFLLILCYCCCAHDNDVSHTLHREWGVTRVLPTCARPRHTRAIPLACVQRCTRHSLGTHPRHARAVLLVSAQRWPRPVQR